MDYMDTAHRSTLEGYSGPVSVIPGIPLVAPIVVQRGHFRRHSPTPGRGPERSGRTRHPGSLHQRDLLSRPKGGSGVGKTKRGKGTKIMAIADRSGFPYALHVDIATAHEVKLVGKILEGRFLIRLPDRLIGDKAYDSAPWMMKMAGLGIEMIAPHRAGRKRAKAQDRRPLRRYRRRWEVERLAAWLQQFRRITVRWECHVQNFKGMVQLGFILISLKSFF